MSRVLAVVAHPDDEVLGCGGTLAKHAANGDDVTALILVSRGLTTEAGKAAGILGATPPWFFGLPDQRLDTLPFLKLVKLVEAHHFNADIVYTHWPHDLNLDHEITARAVLTAFRTGPTILAFETLSSTEWSFGREPFRPNWYVNIDIQRKQKAMMCYASELRSDGHPRSLVGIKTQALRRGFECGRRYAEAFVCLRHVA